MSLRILLPLLCGLSLCAVVVVATTAAAAVGSVVLLLCCSCCLAVVPSVSFPFRFLSPPFPSPSVSFPFRFLSLPFRHRLSPTSRTIRVVGGSQGTGASSCHRGQRPLGGGPGTVVRGRSLFDSSADVTFARPSRYDPSDGRSETLLVLRWPRCTLRIMLAPSPPPPPPFTCFLLDSLKTTYFKKPVRDMSTTWVPGTVLKVGMSTPAPPPLRSPLFFLFMLFCAVVLLTALAG